MSLAMSEHERQEFLAGVHVGVISIERADDPPLTVPIWYQLVPGGLVWIITGAESLKGRLLNAARRFSLSTQTEEPPPTSTSASRDRSSTWHRPSSKPTDARWRTATSARSWATPTWPARRGRQPQVLDAPDSLVVRRLHEALLSATRQTAIMASGFRAEPGSVVDDADPIVRKWRVCSADGPVGHEAQGSTTPSQGPARAQRWSTSLQDHRERALHPFAADPLTTPPDSGRDTHRARHRRHRRDRRDLTRLPHLTPVSPRGQRCSGRRSHRLIRSRTRRAPGWRHRWRPDDRQVLSRRMTLPIGVPGEEPAGSQAGPLDRRPTGRRQPPAGPLSGAVGRPL